ncbi:MAG: DUF2269 family protein [Deltaproteobacteria bacterium]|nr:DUF2269 family protein [Deltaproteobacteria bacterium]
MKTKIPLLIGLGMMGILIILGIAIPGTLTSFFRKPVLYRHALFFHILSVSLFFAHAVFGILWESRSLASQSPVIILHTYRTVTWLDALISSPLIIVAVLTGVILTASIGKMWDIGWLSYSFILFLFSGLIWVVLDIPTQYKIKNLMNEVKPDSSGLPPDLQTLLGKRLKISLLGTIPLLIVFVLMIYKPGLPSIPRILSSF